MVKRLWMLFMDWMFPVLRGDTISYIEGKCH
jgi:hypothetical protein